MMMFAFTWPPDAIWVVSQKVFWFVIVLGVLISFHELGHFLAARWVGVKVLKFSLGFGPKLASRQVGDTEYLVSAVPLGGYVKLFGEDEDEVRTAEDKRRSFTHQRLPGKVFIVAAGPGFNFLLAYLIFTGWLATGAPLFVPTSLYLQDGSRPARRCLCRHSKTSPRTWRRYGPARRPNWPAFRWANGSSGSMRGIFRPGASCSTRSQKATAGK